MDFNEEITEEEARLISEQLEEIKAKNKPPIATNYNYEQPMQTRAMTSVAPPNFADSPESVPVNPPPPPAAT